MAMNYAMNSNASHASPLRASSGAPPGAIDRMEAEIATWHARVEPVNDAVAEVPDLVQQRTGTGPTGDSSSAELTRIHLVHVLQRERGATCGWVASAGGEAFEGLLIMQRALSDEACMTPAVNTKLGDIR